MDDYKAMYLKLFDTVTEAMDMLFKVQKETILMHLDATKNEMSKENEIAEIEKED